MSESIDIYKDEKYKLRVTNMVVAEDISHMPDRVLVNPDSDISSKYRQIEMWGYVGVDMWNEEDILHALARLYVAKQQADFNDNSLDADDIYEEMHGSHTIIDHIKSKRITFKVLLDADYFHINFFKMETVGMNIGYKIPDTDLEAIVNL